MHNIDGVNILQCFHNTLITKSSR